MICIIFIIEAGAARDHHLLLLDMEKIGHLIRVNRVDHLRLIFKRVFLLLLEMSSILGLAIAWLLLEVQLLSFSGVLLGKISNYIFR